MIRDINNKRYDFILIWGNGLQYKNDILKEIESIPSFSILKILNHNPNSMKKFVKEVYSYDYAPFMHLKNKTKYLLTTPKEVCFIFFKNNEPDENWSGNGSFRHQECFNLKKLKEIIRDKFNERKEDRRTENHVIHASDNLHQTDHMLRYLGYKRGIKELEPRLIGSIHYPYHLGQINNIQIKKISLDSLYVNKIVSLDGETKVVKLNQSPQFRFLSNGDAEYMNYLNKFQGVLLKDYYSLDKFSALRDNLSISSYNESSNYIMVRRVEDKYIIMDGVHRASIFLNLGENNILIAEVLN